MRPKKNALNKPKYRFRTFFSKSVTDQGIYLTLKTQAAVQESLDAARAEAASARAAATAAEEARQAAEAAAMAMKEPVPPPRPPLPSVLPETKM